jgi:hypothetical protein
MGKHWEALRGVLLLAGSHTAVAVCCLVLQQELQTRAFVRTNHNNRVVCISSSPKLYIPSLITRR